MISFACIHLGRRFVGMHQRSEMFPAQRRDWQPSRAKSPLVRRVHRFRREDGRLDVRIAWERRRH